MNKIKKGDEVIIMTGKDKGRRGQVLKVFRSSKILVENINLVKKHQKGNPNTGQESGIIEKHDFKGGKARYEQSSDIHHDHLIDVNTGEIVEFVDEEIEKLQNKVAEKLGYKLIDHRLELYGIKTKKN